MSSDTDYLEIGVDKSAQLPTTKPITNAWNIADTTDGRKFYEYQSKYPCHIRVQIFIEALYLATILIISFYHLIWIFGENLTFWCTTLKYIDLNPNLQRIIAFNTAGFIGGAMFGLKYLYHVTARGLWHEDRRIWRIFSPLLAASLSTMIGILIDGGIVHVSDSHSTTNTPYTSYISIGFITGYFADTALAKLQEVATIVFGSSAKASTDLRK